MRLSRTIRIFCFGVSFLFSASGSLAAQDFGGLPGRLEWTALLGDSVTLVTTPSTVDFAERALLLDEALLELQPLSLGERIRDIDIVVQPTTVEPNGFVGLEPFRSYLYATPPQDPAVVSSNAWVDALAIHEYRHVEQYNNLDRGWTRAFRRVFGDGGQAALQGLSTPNWFFEGDAVYYETALTYAGRGRTPSFTALQRALAQDEVKYKYAKARNGSLRSRVPDHYPLGFAMVNHGRLAYGDPWPDVVRGAGNFWPPFYPFSRALRQNTGHSTQRFYSEVYDSLATVWNTRTATGSWTQHREVTQLSRQLDRYATPLPLDSQSETSRLIAVRRSQTRIPEIVELASDGTTRPLTRLGINLDGSLSAAANRVVWSQLRLNPRRENETYSVLMRFDIATGDVLKLTDQTKLFSPGLSPDGQRIVAIERLPGKRPALVFINANSGIETARRELPYDLASYPRFTPDGQQVVLLAKLDGALTYVRVSINEGEPSMLMPWTRHTLGAPFLHDGQVYFSASFTGIDNVFRVALDGSRNIQQLTDAVVSATQPSTNGKDLYFVEVESKGNPVSALAEENWLLRPITVVEPDDLPQYAHLKPSGGAAAFRDRFYATKPGSEALLSARGSSSEAYAKTKPYRGLLRGFSFYTLQPNATQTEASLRVFGGNILADVEAELAAGYNLNEERGFGDARVTVARTWPWINLDLGIAARSINVFGVQEDSAFIDRNRFEQQRAGISLRAPVTQSVGAYSFSLEPALGFDRYRFVAEPTEGLQLPGRSSMSALTAGLELNFLRNRAPKDILPRGGLLFEVAHAGALDGSGDAQTTFSAGLLLPGALPAHTLHLQVRSRIEEAENAYQFADFFRYARGISKPLHDRALEYSADYHFPLLYPDIGFAGLVYARRLRANVWGDYMRLTLPEEFRDRNYTVGSVGVDLIADVTLFNVLDLPIGIRIPYIVQAPIFSGEETGIGDVRLLVSLGF